MQLKPKEKDALEYLSITYNVFTHNEKTKPIVESIGAFPEELKDSFNISNR